MELETILILAVVFFSAGVVKGVLGIGFPAILIGLLTFFVDPREAVSLAIIAMVVTNFRQGFSGEPVFLILKRFWIYCLIGSLGIFIAAYYGAFVSQSILLVSAGIAMVLFGATSLFLNMPQVPDRHDKLAQVIAGVLGAIMGGLTGIWGPPLAAYLASRGLQKNEMVQALGLVFFVQSVPLMIGLIASGALDVENATLGTFLLVPAFTAFLLGERLRNKMNVVQFTRAFMILFILLGLNLIRRGLVS